MLFKVQTPQGVKAIGTINGNTLIKNVYRSKHYHRKFKAWAIQAEALPRLEKLGVRWIRLEIQDTGEVLYTTLECVKKHGFIHDFGFGEQVFLPEKYWESNNQITFFESIA